MSSISLILAASIAHFFAVLSPGPDFVVAVRNSLQYSRKTGVWTALGFALGILVHVTYCMAGVGLIIAQSDKLFKGVKIAGGLYLLYMGYQSLTAASKKMNFLGEIKSDIPWYRGLYMGFITNVLNPKATLFFLSIFTVLLKPDIPSWVTYIAAGIMVLDTFLWFTVVAYLFTQKRIRDAYLERQDLIHKILGVVLVCFGLLVIWL